MAERDTNFFEVVVSQIAQNVRIDCVLTKRRLMTFKTEIP